MAFLTAGLKRLPRNLLLLFFIFSLNLFLLNLAFIVQPQAIWAKATFVLAPLERKFLVLIAREGVEAHIEGRLRQPLAPNPRLEIPRGMVVSLYDRDGALIRRAWKLTQANPMNTMAGDLAVKAAFDANSPEPPLTAHEARQARIRVSVLSDYVRLADPSEIKSSDAVVIQYGFSEGVCLPGDTASNNPEDKLACACQSIGLEPNFWMLDSAILLRAKINEMQEAGNRN